VGLVVGVKEAFTFLFGVLIMAVFNLDQGVYEPLALPVTNGELELRNDHSGSVEIRELSAGSPGDVLRIQLIGNNGTPNVYLGTEGSLSIVPGDGNNNFPRITPLDETAVLTWTVGAGFTGGDAWVLTWE
jgi:hypothetical protein